MAIIIAQVDVHWGDAFDGFVPSSALFQHGALYTCKRRENCVLVALWLMHPPAIGIIGATVMPHSIFLGSALATQNRLPDSADKLSRVDSSFTVDSETTCVPRTFKFSIPAPADLLRCFRRGFVDAFRVVPADQTASEPKTHADRENNSYAFVRAHIYHGTIDISISLLGLAVVINSL